MIEPRVFVRKFLSRAAVAVLGLAFAIPSHAQSGSSGSYVGLDAGLTLDASEFSVRSGLGASIGGLVGRQLGRGAAAELRFGFERFGAPTRIINPGGCLGAVPCVFPTPERVHIATLGLDALARGSLENAIPFLLVGVGGRYVDAHPGRSEVRPYLELGTGIGIPVGGASMSVEVRYQLAFANSEFPAWTLPLALAVRF